MSFKMKTQAEIDKMTAEEFEGYSTAKAEFETSQRDEAIKAAVDAAKGSLAEAIKAATDKAAELEGIIEKQGAEISNLRSSGEGATAAKAVELKAEIQKLHDRTTKGMVAEKIEMKTFADDVMAVQNVPASGGGTVTGALASVAQFFAQVLPTIYRKPVPTSNILDRCDVMPLVGNELVSISEVRTVSVAVTAEGAVKPISKSSWTPVIAQANPVASIFKTTTKMRKYFPIFLKSFIDTLTMFINKVIPANVVSTLGSTGTAFSPTAAQSIYADPNEYDVIVQVIATLVNLGYVPNSVRISNVMLAKIKTLRGTTNDAYLVQNYGAINILGTEGIIQFGSFAIPLETDVELADDAFIIGDLTTVKVGLDDQIEYSEAVAGEDDLKQNKRSHVIERFVAVNHPTSLRSGVIVDTFANCKALLTN